MVQVQAELISQLNERIKNFSILEDKYQRYEKYAKFYAAMQDVIIRSPMLQASWSNFLLQLKMAATEDEMKNLDSQMK
jgi:hypothetical protein